MKNQRKLLDLEGRDLEKALEDLIVNNEPHPRWSAKEEEILRRLYGKIPTKLLAQQLGKTYGAINVKVVRLGITKPYKRNNDHDR